MSLVNTMTDSFGTILENKVFQKYSGYQKKISKKNLKKKLLLNYVLFLIEEKNQKNSMIPCIHKVKWFSLKYVGF